MEREGGREKKSKESNNSKRNNFDNVIEERRESQQLAPTKAGGRTVYSYTFPKFTTLYHGILPYIAGHHSNIDSPN